MYVSMYVSMYVYKRTSLDPSSSKAFNIFCLLMMYIEFLWEFGVIGLLPATRLLLLLLLLSLL